MSSDNQAPPTAPIKTERSVEFILKSQQALIDTYAWQCCINCEHWTDKHIERVKDETKYSGFRDSDMGPRCTKYAILPPPKVITIGCESYEPMIPF